MHKHNFTSLVLVCLLAGCGETLEQVGGKSSPQLTGSDNGFFKMIALSNMTEIKTSQLAMERSTNSSVKDFAQQMIDDHTEAAGKVGAVSSSKGVGLPTSLDSKHQMLFDDLKTKSGSDFDRAYIDLQVKAHKETVEADKDETENGSDPQVKQLATQLLSTLDMHLQMAEKLQSGM